METNAELDKVPESINQRFEECIKLWKLEFETRDAGKPDFSYQKQLGQLVSEAIGEGKQVRISILKTPENANDLNEFIDKKELPDGTFEIVVKAVGGEQTNPNKEKLAIFVPSQRSEVVIAGTGRRTINVYPNEIPSMSVWELEN